MEEHELASIFLDGAPAQGLGPGGMAELGRLLKQKWDGGRAQWPGIALSAEVFVRHLAGCWATLGGDPPLGQFLEELATRDFYLACACAHEVPRAAEAFEQHYLAKLPAQLDHLKQPQAFIDDMCQTIRERLLVRTAEAPPKIADYTGRGALMGWVRIITLRMAVRVIRGRRDADHETDVAALAALPSPGMDPELEVIKRNYQSEFLQAMKDAFAALSNDQRYLLRLYFVDRLSTTEVAALFRVNQSTISRWLHSARQAIYTETKRLLKERLNLSSREFDSLLQVVDSQLDMSINHILGKEEAVG